VRCDIAIGIVTTYGLNDWEVRVRAQREMNFRLLHIVQTGTFPVGSGGNRQQGRAADHTAQLHAEVYKTWTYTPASPIRPSWRSVRLRIEHKDHPSPLMGGGGCIDPLLLDIDTERISEAVWNTLEQNLTTTVTRTRNLRPFSPLPVAILTALSRFQQIQQTNDNT
jgi:hypothetical protein